MPIPTLTDEPGAIELAAQIRDGALSPLDAVDACIARIEALDGPINAVVVRDFDRAREHAKHYSRQGPGIDQPLFGVPMTIKESFDVAGLPTTWGHPEYKDNVARSDSLVVRRLLQAGAIIVGKTNVPPDLADWQSTNPVYGRTANPHDLSRSPGGSSGGSAAAVASGMVPCEFGTDIGGSVRVPAHFCGVWGHKTSWGVISKQGHDHPAFAGIGAHDGALSIAGPIARNPDDLALLLERTASFPLRRSGDPMHLARFLVIDDLPGSPVADGVRAQVHAVADALEKAGVTVDRSPRRTMPDFARAHADYLKMLNVAMARGAPAPDGTRATATDWFDLLDAQARLEAAWQEVFSSHTFVLAPPAPVVAVPEREGRVFDGTIDIDGREESSAAALAWAGIATFPNLPSTVLPVGEVGGLPCGLQVIGERYADLDCIGAAAAIAKIIGR
jgi:amidase